MSKLLLYKLALLVGLALAGVWSFYALPDGRENELAKNGDSLLAVEGEVLLPNEENIESGGGSSKDEQLYLVTRVIDGDTVEIEGSRQIRYVGIDAPEAKSKDCFGQEATEKNKQLVLGKKIRLEKDVSDTDVFGRLLRYVYAGDVFINLEMIGGGYARSYKYPPDIKHQISFDNAQNSAKNKSLGIWSSSCTSTPLPATIPTVSFTPTPTATLTTTPTPSATATPIVTPVPAFSATPSPTPPPLAGEHIFYLSTYHSAKYYYCDTDNGWKALSEKYLKSYPSEQELLADYPTKILHEPCK